MSIKIESDTDTFIPVTLKITVTDRDTAHRLAVALNTAVIGDTIEHVVGEQICDKIVCELEGLAGVNASFATKDGHCVKSTTAFAKEHPTLNR